MWPDYSVKRCAALGVSVVRAMQEARGWSVDRYVEMLARWGKEYKRDYVSRAELEAFLRSVGQR